MIFAQFVVAALLGTFASAQLVQLETPRDSQRDQRREFALTGETSAFKLRFNAATGVTRVDNAAVLTLQVDKVSNKFLSTLPGAGAAQFLTAVKPCGIIVPHLHPRATEFYSVIAGTMSGGVAQENGALQNITFTVTPGEVMVVPQGLVHYNHNAQCTANVFFQTFNSADPGALNIVNALAAFNANPAATSAITASNVTARPTRFGALELDAACLARCGFPPTGAPKWTAGLSAATRALFGL